MTWDEMLGYFSGLRLVAPDLAPWTLVRTLLVLHTCNAAMCRLLAMNKGYAVRPWTVAGFFLGIWAVALLMVLPDRRPPQ